MNITRKIESLQSQIDNLKTRPLSIFKYGLSLSDEEKEAQEKKERDWIHNRIAELVKEIGKLKQEK